jgi:hypothetical protein
LDSEHEPPPAAKMPSAAPPSSQRPIHHAFLPNLVLIVVVGVASSAWILAYTDDFPAIGGLLALGGAFSWIAFVSGILTEARRDQIQAFIDRGILDRSFTTVVVCAAAAWLAFFASGRASVEIDSTQDGASLTSFYQPPGAARGDTLFVEAHARARHVIRTRPWGVDTVRVKVEGLPDQILTLHALDRMRLQIPYSFIRPVLLLVPSPKLTGLLAENPLVLEVTVHGRKLRLEDYRGGSVWVGCDSDVRVPMRLQEEWRNELTANGRGLLASLWLYPRGVAGPRIDLVPGDTVAFRVAGARGSDLVNKTVIIGPLTNATDFPQVERLYEPESESPND